MDVLRLREIRVHRLAVPMRVRFEHAAATRSVADPVVVEVQAEAPYAHLAGFGETLARPYVTGETPESVAEDVCELFAPPLLEFRAGSFPEALEAIDALPALIDGRIVNAARAGVELALLDLIGKVCRRRACEVAGWLDLPGFGPPGCLPHARYSGIVVGRGWKGSAFLRLQRAFALRDFKLKVAVPGWEQRLERAARTLRSDLRRGRATLRVDANGGWSADEARAAIPLLLAAGVSALEQPLPRDQDDALAELSRATPLALVADESLVTQEDAERLLEQSEVRVFNVRLAKVGGLLPALRMASSVLRAGRDVQLGCLVGETSILSAAGIAFLECCPQVRFVEGAFGGFLLRDDVVRRPVRFGFAGTVAARKGYGLGVDVQPAALARLAAAPPRTVRF